MIKILNGMLLKLFITEMDIVKFLRHDMTDLQRYHHYAKARV